MSDQDPLKNARERYQKKVKGMTPEQEKIAGAKAKDLLADDAERNLNAKITVVRWILWAIIGLIVAACIVIILNPEILWKLLS